MARIHYLQHVPFEGLGSIEGWLTDNGHTLSSTHLYHQASLPDITTFDMLIVMGGPMGIYDYREHPWLKQEKSFIRACIDASKPVLGICLGAQLIADVLGGKVTHNPEKEIGWFPVEVTTQGKDTAIGTLLAEAKDVLHWHGDTFAIPPGAIHLARSAACEHQAFLNNERVLGLQFHLEMTPAGAAALCSECAHELVPARYVQSANEILAPATYFQQLNQVMQAILAQLLARAHK